MKGLTHFISGVAFGTFFPSAVAAAEAQKSLILVLGGVGGILPDTFDFKFARFLEKFDIEVDPDHDDPNPQKIAEAVAEAINRAHEEQKTIKLLLHTIRMGADAWRKYSVYFNSEKQRIEVTIGPVVTTSQVPYLPSLPSPEKRFGTAPVKVPFVHTYDRANDVTIFSGPDFDMKPRDGFIEIEFLSWHRRWSHSLTLAAVGGVVTTILAYLLQALGMTLSLAPWMYGLILAGGGCMHILEDQTGFMGSNLLYPFTKERATGAKWFHSGHAISNFTTFYLMVTLIIFNLNRLTPPEPVFDVAWWEYWLIVFFIPMTLLHTIAAMWSDPLPDTAQATDDTLDIGVEAKEDGGGI